jgi:colicin import membrane protein
MIAAAAGALVLLGAGMALKLQGDTADSAARAAATSLSVERQLHEAREEASRKLLEEQARSQAIAEKAEQARAEMERARASALEEKAQAEQEKKRAAEAAKARSDAEAQQKAAAAATARARAVKKPAPASSGRRIRTTL